MISSDNGESYHLHIPSLYKDVNDVQCVWKKNKCIVKIYKRVDEPWPTIDKKPVESKRGEDEMWEEGDVGGGRKSKFMDKSKVRLEEERRDELTMQSLAAKTTRACTSILGIPPP